MNQNKPELYGLVRARGQSRKSHLWLVSFGDLLTLLLCFFLSIITFGPIGETKVESKTDITHHNNGENIDAVKGSPVEQTSGTALAMYNNDSVEPAFTLTEADYPKTALVLSEKAWGRFKNEATLESYEGTAVLVETCTAAARTAAAKARFIAMSRGLAIRSHLIDTGVAPGDVRLRSVGNVCKLLRGRSHGDDDVVGIITFLSTEETSGGRGEERRAG